MKNKAQIATALGLMCIILVSSIMIQLNTIKEATKIVGTSYAEQGLKDEVLRQKESYERLYKDFENKEKELEIAREESTKENSSLLELREELEKANGLLGLTEITGEGIVLTVRDNDAARNKEMEINVSKALVHDEDLRQLVNELKNAGAEAISINGQRIVSSTSIICSGAIVKVNGVKLNSPFEISAIGNPSTLRGIDRVRWLFASNGRRRNNRKY